METLEAQPSSKTRMDPGFSRGRDTRPFAHTRVEINAPRGEIPVAKPRLVCARPTGASTTTAGATTYGGFVGSRLSLPASDTPHPPPTNSAASALPRPCRRRRHLQIPCAWCGGCIPRPVSPAASPSPVEAGSPRRRWRRRAARATRIQTGRVVSPAAASRPEPPRAVSGADRDAFIADVAADKSKAVQVRAR